MTWPNSVAANPTWWQVALYNSTLSNKSNDIQTIGTDYDEVSDNGSDNGGGRNNGIIEVRGNNHNNDKGYGNNNCNTLNPWYKNFFLYKDIAQYKNIWEGSHTNIIPNFLLRNRNWKHNNKVLLFDLRQSREHSKTISTPMLQYQSCYSKIN